MFTTESRAMVATNTALMAFAVLSVVLRFQVRRPKAFRLEIDDYMILTALVRMSHRFPVDALLIVLFKVLLYSPRRYEHSWRFCCRLWSSVRVLG